MRVSIVNNNGNFERLVDINGGVTFCDTESILDNILMIEEDNKDAVTARKRFLDFANRVCEGSKNEKDKVYEESLLIYGSDVASTVFNHEFKVVNFKCDETLNLLLNLYRDQMMHEEVEDPRVQVTDFNVTGIIPDKVSVAFRTKEETMQAFKDLMEKGYIDTSNAVFIVAEYFSRRRFDNYDIRMQAYLVNRE